MKYIMVVSRNIPDYWYKSNVAAVATVFLTFLACSLFFPPIHSLWLDETSSYFFSTLPWVQYIEHMVNAEANMSLYYTLLKLYLSVGIDNVIFIRLLSAVFGLGAIACVYVFCRTAINQRVAFWVSLFLAFNPFLYQYFWEARSYSMLAFFGALCMLLFWRALLVNTRTQWLIYSLMSGIGMYSHLFLGLLLMSQYLFVLVYLVREQKMAAYAFNVIFSGLVVVIVSLPILLFFVLVGSGAANISWVETAGLSDVAHFFQNVFKTKYSVNSFVEYSSRALVVLCFLSVAWWAVRSFIIKQSDDRLYVMLYLAIVSFVPALLLFLLQFVQPVFVERYLIFSVAPFVVLVCVIALNQKVRLVRIGILVTLFIVQSGGLYESQSRQKFDFDALYEDLSQVCEPGSSLMFTHAGASTTYLYYKNKYQNLANCFQHVEPTPLTYNNFYKKISFDELPKLNAEDKLWVVFGYAGAPSRSIYSLHDEAELEASGYLRSFYRQYPINLALIQLQGKK